MRIKFQVLLALVCLPAFAMGQQPAEPVIKSLQDAKFNSSASLPDCVSVAVEQGDVKGSRSVILLKTASGCVIPMHWHSSAEEVSLVRGYGQVTMPGKEPQAIDSGGYMYFPAKHTHQFVCKDANGCVGRRINYGPLDVHYVDAAGNEISPDRAMAAFNEHPVGSFQFRLFQWGLI
jgi:quercetin dioxygenase-like cupin family protein